MVQGIQIPNLPPVIALNGTEQFETVQAGVSSRVTLDQIGLYISNTFGGGGGGALIVGTSVVLSGTSSRILYDNAGVLGEYAITGTGNVMMGTNPTITGTILKNGASVLPWYNVQTDFGVDMTGTTDSTAAWNAAVAAWNTAPGIFFIPRGTVRLDSKPNAFTSAGGRILGSGEGSTIIAAAYTGDDIIRINNQFTSISDMTFSPSVFRSSGYDIVFGFGCYRNSARNTAHIYGGQGVRVTDASGVSLDQITMFNMIGVHGVLFDGTAANGGSFGLNIAGSVFSITRPVEWTTFKAFATSDSYTQGQVTQSGGYYWICDVAGTTAGSPSGLTIDTSTPSSWATTNVVHGTAEFRVLCNEDMEWINIDSYASSLILLATPVLGGTYGVTMTDSAAALGSYPNWVFAEDLECDHQVQSAVLANGGKGLTFSNCWFGSTLLGQGIWTNGAYLGETTVTGSKFLALGSTGIWLGAGVDTQITGNEFLACSTAAIGTLPAIYIAPDVGKVGIVGNLFGSHVGVGVGYMSRAVLIDTGTGDYITITGNTSYDLATTPAILNGASGTHNVIRNNNPVQAGTTLTIGEGGTGVTGTPTNGQLLIGNGTGYTLASLTAGTGISITPGAGSITIANTATVPNPFILTSAASNAISVGPNGDTNPVFRIDASTASQAAGLQLTGAVAAGTVALGVISSGANASLSIDAKGSGNLSLLAAATGGVGIGTASAPAQLVEVSRSQSAGTWLQVTNASDNVAATAGVRLVTGSGGDYVDFFTSGNLNYFQFSGGGGIVDGRMGFDAITMQTVAAAQMTRLTTAGLRVGSTIADATSPLMVEGPISTPIVTVTGDTTVTAAHSTIISNRGAINTLTLPAASGCVGRKYHIVNLQAFDVVSASANVVPIDGGAATTDIVPPAPGAYAIIQSNGTNWVIIANN